MPGKKKGWKMSEEGRKKISERQKGHKQTNFGKKVDSKLFKEAYNEWACGKWHKKKFAEYVGLHRSTLEYRLRMILEDGYIDGVYFTDGKPYYAYYGKAEGLALVKPKLRRTKPKCKKNS